MQKREPAVLDRFKGVIRSGPGWTFVTHRTLGFSVESAPVALVIADASAVQAVLDASAVHAVLDASAVRLSRP